MTVATYQTLNFGANPAIIDGPSTLGSGVIVPNYKLGHVSYGDCESEYVYVKLTLAAPTIVIPGQAYWLDDDYNATLLSTASSPRGAKVVIACANSVTALPAGAYFMWCLRSGQFPVAAVTITVAVTAGGVAETSATAGSINTPAAAATVGSKLIVGLYYTKAPATFTATTTVGSAVLTGPFTGVSTASGPFAGAAIAGTGIPASTIIQSIQVAGNVVQSITMGNAAGALVNATASGSAIVVTPTLMGEARVMWAYIDKTN
jgi:hypothetical protein